MTDIMPFTRPMSRELRHILPREQARFLRDLATEGFEEYDGILSIAEEQAENFRRMPELYATDGKSPEERTVFLHYFVCNCDWWLLEKGEGEFYGLCKILEPEFGYVSLQDLKTTKFKLFSIELDFYWEPKPLSEVLDEEEILL